MSPQRYIRITKTHARERWEAGLPIRLCPCKFMPGGGWAPDMLAQDAGQNKGRYTFDEIVRDFCSYNANSHETGYYAHYYITNDMDPEPLQMIVRRKVREARRRR